MDTFKRRLGEITDATNLRDDMTSVLAEHLGVKVAKAAVSFVKKPTGWNGYVRHRFKTALEEVKAKAEDASSVGKKPVPVCYLIN